MVLAQWWYHHVIRPLVAALATCCLYRSSESIITPRILVLETGSITFPLIMTSW
jgi:hypothetical protein